MPRAKAARRAAEPANQLFAIGFLTGLEIDWLPEVMCVLRDELPKIDVTVSSQSSSRDLGDALMIFVRRHVGQFVGAPERLTRRGSADAAGKYTVFSPPRSPRSCRSRAHRPYRP